MLEAIIGEGFKLEKLERLGRGSNQCGNTLYWSELTLTLLVTARKVKKKEIPLMVTDVAPVIWISSRFTAVREMKNKSSSVNGIKFESPKILNRLKPLKSKPLPVLKTPLSERFFSTLV